MKFDNKYETAEPGIPASPFIVYSLHADQARPCEQCREETRWFHRELYVHLCSEECVQAFSARMN
jgi:hypothetical protein